MSRLRIDVEKFEFDWHVPAQIVRLIVVGGVVSVVAMGVLYSRDERPDIAVGADGVSIKQKQKMQPGLEAEVLSKEAPSSRVADNKETPSSTERLEKRNRTGPNYYFERVRVQGDAYEGEFVIVKRLCVPPNMPEVCYLPREQRNKILVERN
jgi:hypothetical protein